MQKAKKQAAIKEAEGEAEAIIGGRQLLPKVSEELTTQSRVNRILQIKALESFEKAAAAARLQR